MKYSLNCYIKTDNDGIRNAAKQLIPDVSDGRVSNLEYRFDDGISSIDGIKYFICRVLFSLESDRNGIYNSVKALPPIINICEIGSYVRAIKTYHDEPDNTRECEIQMEVVKI